MESKLCDNERTKKRTKPTVREMNTAIFALRAFSVLHMSMDDLEQMNYGDVIDMMIEMSNDEYDWPLKATQEDIDAFARL